MGKYRKKPVVIEAIEYTGDNFHECLRFGNGAVKTNGDTLVVNTLEGKMKASLGDYLIKGVAGEFYFCKPDIFEQTYEPMTPKGKI